MIALTLILCLLAGSVSAGLYNPVDTTELESRAAALEAQTGSWNSAATEVTAMQNLSNGWETARLYAIDGRQQTHIDTVQTTPDVWSWSAQIVTSGQGSAVIDEAWLYSLDTNILDMTLRWCAYIDDSSNGVLWDIETNILATVLASNAAAGDTLMHGNDFGSYRVGEGVVIAGTGGTNTYAHVHALTNDVMWIRPGLAGEALADAYVYNAYVVGPRYCGSGDSNVYQYVQGASVSNVFGYRFLSRPVGVE